MYISMCIYIIHRTVPMKNHQSLVLGTAYACHGPSFLCTRMSQCCTVQPFWPLLGEAYKTVHLHSLVRYTWAWPKCYDACWCICFFSFSFGGCASAWIVAVSYVICSCTEKHATVYLPRRNCIPISKMPSEASDSRWFPNPQSYELVCIRRPLPPPPPPHRGPSFPSPPCLRMQCNAPPPVLTATPACMLDWKCCMCRGVIW